MIRWELLADLSLCLVKKKKLLNMLSFHVTWLGLFIENNDLVKWVLNYFDFPMSPRGKDGAAKAFVLPMWWAGPF